MAFNLTQKLEIKHKFNKEKELAGYDLSVRKSKDVSLSQYQAMNKVEVN